MEDGAGNPTQAGKSVVDEYLRKGGEAGHDDRVCGRKARTTSRRRVKGAGALVQSEWESADQLGGKDAECQHSLVEGRNDLPMRAKE